MTQKNVVQFIVFLLVDLYEKIYRVKIEKIELIHYKVYIIKQKNSKFIFSFWLIKEYFFYSFIYIIICYLFNEKMFFNISLRNCLVDIFYFEQTRFSQNEITCLEISWFCINYYLKIHHLFNLQK